MLNVSLFLSLIHISEPTRLLSISYVFFCFLIIRRPPRSTLSSSSAASDVYKRQLLEYIRLNLRFVFPRVTKNAECKFIPVSYTHLRAHETPEHLVCRLLLEKK